MFLKLQFQKQVRFRNVAFMKYWFLEDEVMKQTLDRLEAAHLQIVDQKRELEERSMEKTKEDSLKMHEKHDDKSLAIPEKKDQKSLAVIVPLHLRNFCDSGE